MLCINFHDDFEILNLY